LRRQRAAIKPIRFLCSESPSSMKPVDTNEAVVVVALGANGTGARMLSRVTRKSWEELGLAEGVSVYAQLKAVALAPGRGVCGERAANRQGAQGLGREHGLTGAQNYIR
jgi:molybdopterin-binding protein